MAGGQAGGVAREKMGNGEAEDESGQLNRLPIPGTAAFLEICKPPNPLDFRQIRQQTAGGAKLQLGHRDLKRAVHVWTLWSGCTDFPWCWSRFSPYFTKFIFSFIFFLCFLFHVIFLI